ncbi:hypothetical protein DFJ77DRAFT_351206 [Powellomyces hirtus]|nr:hypothetical protein DFJ77DRAFT_351206 [Powellomyces hirtus]
MKIGVCDSMLRPNPPDCSFVLLVELTNPTHPSAPPPNIPSSAWVPGEPAEVDLDANASIVPLKTMDAGLLKMQLYAEESARKGKS